MNSADRPPAALILAAGASVRMGARNKLLEPIDGVPMVRTVVTRVLQAAFAPVVVVTGHDAEAIRSTLAGCAVRFAHNPAPARGMGCSLAVGAHAIADHQATLVALGDMPDVTVETLLALQRALRKPGAAVVAPSFEGRRGNPVLFCGALLSALRACTGDVGAKAVLQRAGDGLHMVPVDDPGVQRDFDTPGDLEQRPHADRGRDR